jgi:hypothetical protein
MSMSMSMSNRHSRIVLVLSSVALLLTVWAQPAPVLAAPWFTSCRACAPGTPPSCPYVTPPGFTSCKIWVDAEGIWHCEEFGSCPS